ncbi:MAG: hypothetical protein ABGX04_08575, partial [Myxococcales bacterium]
AIAIDSPRKNGRHWVHRLGIGRTIALHRGTARNVETRARRCDDLPGFIGPKIPRKWLAPGSLLRFGA